MRISMLFALVAAALVPAVVIAAPEDTAAKVPRDRVPVLVELFTSEGCSSCPPADQLLRRLAAEQPIAGADIIALSQHVDYWNRLGWTDPFSDGRFSRRQQEYSRQRWPGRVYTPQMVVDGERQFVGSDAGDAHSAIEEAARRPKAEIELKIAPRDSRRVLASIHAGKIPVDEGNVDVVLAITEDNLSVNVPRGENRGRKLIHSGVVRAWREIGSIDAGKTAVFEWTDTVRVSPEWDLKNLRAVVFLQERPLRRVLGAVTVRLSRD